MRQEIFQPIHKILRAPQLRRSTRKPPPGHQGRQAGFAGDVCQLLRELINFLHVRRVLIGEMEPVALGPSTSPFRTVWYE